MTGPGEGTTEPHSSDEEWPSARVVLKSWSLDRIAQWNLAGAPAGTSLLGDAWAAGIQRDLAEHGYTITREATIRAEEEARVRKQIADAIWALDPGTGHEASYAQDMQRRAAETALGDTT